MREIAVDVIGTEPPCSRCTLLKKNAEKAALKLKPVGIEVKVSKLNVISEEVMNRYGMLVSPALAINGIVKVMGRVPSENEIEKILRDVASR